MSFDGPRGSSRTLAGWRLYGQWAESWGLGLVVPESPEPKGETDEGKGTDRRELAAALHRPAPRGLRRTHPADQLRWLPGALRAADRCRGGGRRPAHAQRH